MLKITRPQTPQHDPHAVFMKKEKKQQIADKKYWFLIENNTFKVDCLVLLNYTLDESSKIIKQETGEEYEFLQKESKGTEVLGSFFALEKGYCILLNWYKNTYQDNMLCALHELLHLTHHVLRNVRVPLTEQSEEVYTYLFENFTRQFMDKTWKKYYK
jgi:hypothetical protein